MKVGRRISLIVLLAWAVISGAYSCEPSTSEAAEQLVRPTPTPAQYFFHEQERIMFVSYDPATWQGYGSGDHAGHDQHTTPLEQINPTKLDTDQWCQAALAWGAREILFVAKHTGGFCWWQTDTTDYSIRKTAWRGGKGDVLVELAKSCRKYGLNLGIYVYTGDESWGAAIGSGGRTSDPAKQEAYNKVYRQQLRKALEIASRYVPVVEVWFDGSCVIEVGDILKTYAPKAVIFQGPHATIRWSGNEVGYLPYPAWNALSKHDLATGAATAANSDPNGNAWAPLEADTALYGEAVPSGGRTHRRQYWFWSPANEKKRKSLDELMNIYYKAVGRGGVMLLNSSPNTDGLITEDDVQRYRDLGAEIEPSFRPPHCRDQGARKHSRNRSGKADTRQPCPGYGGLLVWRTHPLVRRRGLCRRQVDEAGRGHFRGPQADRLLRRHRGNQSAVAHQPIHRLPVAAPLRRFSRHQLPS